MDTTVPTLPMLPMLPTLPMLPLEILVHIAQLSTKTCACMLALPQIGRMTLHKNSRKYLFKPFIIVKDEADYKIEYYFGDMLHRDDGPAVEYNDGDVEWYRYGKLHRDRFPARIWGTTREWYQNGRLHRDGDEFAVDSPLKSEWYQNGLLHRDGDRPAVEKYRRDKYGGTYLAKEKYYVNGKLYRENGPAIIRYNT